MIEEQRMEVEVKLRLPSLEGFQDKLTAWGFCLEVPFQEDESVLWDKDGELLAKKSALRLRHYGDRYTLTWKGPRVEDPLFKIRPEWEVGVEEGKATEEILRALGFVPVMRMIKKRAVLRKDSLVACLDEAPFGCFLELEGESTAIRAVMTALDLGPELAEKRSYPALFREYQAGQC